MSPLLPASPAPQANSTATAIAIAYAACMAPAALAVLVFINLARPAALLAAPPVATAFPAAPPAPDAATPFLPPAAAAAWQLAWEDGFDYPDAELDQRWVSQNGPSGHILSSRWRENAVVRDGTLRLVNRKQERGGQSWTSGNVWTKRQFQYGYFECRYRYAAAEGTNNSFWLMTNTPGEPAAGKRFEIDINEGHYPNEINTNIHNWSDLTVLPNGKKTHPTASKSFVFGVRPDVAVQLEIPVRARRLRLTSTHPSHFHLREFRVYGVHPEGYPDVLSVTADNDRPGLANFARDADAKITVSGFHKDGPDTRDRLVDGRIDTSWVSQSNGEKSVEIAWPGERVIGGVQFINGWQHQGGWKDLLENYRLDYHDGEKWIEMAAFDIKGGTYDFSRDFHVYGLDWSPEELVFYFNGQEIRREKNHFAHSPSPVWLSLAIISWAGRVSDTIDGTQMEIDYVRVYQRR
jgi:beta-glucanase (GH16 family)